MYDVVDESGGGEKAPFLMVDAMSGRLLKYRDDGCMMSRELPDSEGGRGNGVSGASGPDGERDTKLCS